MLMSQNWLYPGLPSLSIFIEAVPSTAFCFVQSLSIVQMRVSFADAVFRISGRQTKETNDERISGNDRHVAAPAKTGVASENGK